MYFCFHFNIASDIVTLIFVNIYHFIYTFSRAHTEAHTHKHTRMVSTQKEWRPLGTGAWLRGAAKRLLLEKKALRIKKIKKNVIKPRSQILKTFEHIELLAKLLDCFVRSDTSNNNQ